MNDWEIKPKERVEGYLNEAESIFNNLPASKLGPARFQDLLELAKMLQNEKLQGPKWATPQDLSETGFVDPPTPEAIEEEEEKKKPKNLKGIIKKAKDDQKEEN